MDLTSSSLSSAPTAANPSMCCASWTTETTWSPPPISAHTASRPMRSGWVARSLKQPRAETTMPQRGLCRTLFTDPIRLSARLAELSPRRDDPDRRIWRNVHPLPIHTHHQSSADGALARLATEPDANVGA